MSVLRYGDYISEKVVYELLLESKVVFSKGFVEILTKMRDNIIASQLLKIYTKEADIQHNYIDITGEKDEVSFTPDKKIKELNKDKPELWQVAVKGKALPHKEGNLEMFNFLGYDTKGKMQKEKTDDEEKVRVHWSPPVGTRGLVLKTQLSTGAKGRTYALFQEYGKKTETPNQCVINVEALAPFLGDDTAVWKTARNNIKVGRLARAILTSVDVKFTDKDIEEFTNLFKATYDFTKDALKQFGIVSGDLIGDWYNHERYLKGGGPLNNSCMASVGKNRFRIYMSNPESVSLVILYGDGGKIGADGNYTAPIIKGRALLWNATIDKTPQKFMDRIYTVQDSDVKLFQQFAIRNGWWYKTNQNMQQNEYITNGKETKQANIDVQLDNVEFPTYPYCDTMSFLNKEKKLVTNRQNSSSRYTTMRST